MSVRTSASGEIPAKGQLKSILTYAFGVKKVESDLYHNLEYGDFLSRRGSKAYNKKGKLL